MKIISKVSFCKEDWSKNEHVTHCKTTLHDFFKQLDIEYPKFHKMDILSKKAFLLTEYLLQDQKIDASRTGIFIWNQKSSLESDLKHLENITHDFENPANFVYTLPNIAIGEIAIRHKITGETGFFITSEFSEIEMTQTLALYAETYTDYFIAGYIGPSSAVLYLFVK